MSLRKERICAAKSCNKSEPIDDGVDASNSKLKWCSRCKIIRYCSQDCQKLDFTAHMKNCKEVSVLTKKADRSFQDLQFFKGRESEPNHRGRIRINLGSFSYDAAIDLPHEYLKKFRDMVEYKWNIVKECESWELYQMMVADFLEVMRQSFGMDPFDLQVNFLLIAVNRDGDAYNLIKDWVCRDHSCFKETYKGDWIYLTGQDKTEDFYNDVLPRYERSQVTCFNKLALLAIKMKTINAMQAKAETVDYFAEELEKTPEKSQTKKIAQSWPVMDCIQTFVLGYKKSKYENVLKQQEEHLQTYLKAITNTQVLQDLLQPDVRTVNSQYDDSIKCGFRLFKQIPGALVKIKQFLSQEM